jgi:hypothetical protein
MTFVGSSFRWLVIGALAGSIGLTSLCSPQARADANCVAAKAGPSSHHKCCDGDHRRCCTCSCRDPQPKPKQYSPVSQTSLRELVKLTLAQNDFAPSAAEGSEFIENLSRDAFERPLQTLVDLHTCLRL